MLKQFAPLCLGLVLLTSFSAFAAEEKEPTTISFGEGHFEMTVPEGWKTVQPKVRIIDHEFSAPAKEEGATAGRATLMGAGGGVDANVARWKGQFTKLTADDVKEEKVAGMKVHIVELKGDFKDQRGPFVPAEIKKDYTVLGAIITTDKLGDYFLKFYGPSDTINENKEKFTKMVNSLKVK